MKNYYTELTKWGKTGDLENVPTNLIKDYISDLTTELNSRITDKKSRLMTVGISTNKLHVC